MVRRARKNERGIALLATLLAIALMALLVVDFTVSSVLAYRSAANRANQLRAACLARSGVAVGLSILAQDSVKDALTQTPYDALNEIWALPFPPVPLGGGMVTLSIVDEARKLDINELVDQRTGAVNPRFAEILTRLLAIIGVNPGVIPAIADWLDADSIPNPGGAEADYYLRLRPPYEPRNGPMPTIGDLRMVRGIDDLSFRRLRDFLTVAPEPRVNVNTAPPQVLAALSPELAGNPSVVQEIVTARLARPFLQLSEIANLPGLGQLANQLTQMLTTRSDYFTIIGVGTYAGARKFVFATFRRSPDGTAMVASWHED